MNIPDQAAEWLLSSDGFKVTCYPGREALHRLWLVIFENLVEDGYMTRSKTGRYWWTNKRYSPTVAPGERAGGIQ